MKKALIEEYKNLVQKISETDYSNKASLSSHNNSVKRMYEIVEMIGRGNTNATLKEFAELLDIQDHEINLWTSIHLLERVSPDLETEKQALHISTTAVQDGSADTMGYRLLVDYMK